MANAKSFRCGFHILCISHKTKRIKRREKKSERIGWMCNTNTSTRTLIGNEYNMTEPWQMTFYGRFVCKQIPLDSITIFTLPCFFCVYACDWHVSTTTAKTFNRWINICDASKHLKEVDQRKKNAKWTSKQVSNIQF